jgi:hypothetical protein
VDGQAGLVMGRVGGVGGFPGDCHPLVDPDSRCSELFANTSAAASAAAVRGGAEAEINRTRIHLNVSNDKGSSAITVAGPDTRLNAEGILVHDQIGANSLVRLVGGSLMRLRWSTIAGNDDDEALASVFARLAGADDQFPQLNVDSSIIWEPSLSMFFGASTQPAAADCVIAHLDAASSGFDSINFYSQVDPRLRDRYNGDLRLAPDSPAIDYCDDAIAPDFDDFFDRPRGVEYNLDPDIPPVDSVPGGLFDLGAFEQPHFEDAIHADRFED